MAKEPEIHLHTGEAKHRNPALIGSQTNYNKYQHPSAWQIQCLTLYVCMCVCVRVCVCVCVWWEEVVGEDFLALKDCAQ